MDGALIGTILYGWCTLMAVAPLRRPRGLAVLSWISALTFNELPFVVLGLVAVSWVPPVLGGDLAGPADWVGLGLAGLTVVGLAIIVRRALRSGAVMSQALEDGLGERWHDEIDPGRAGRPRHHLPWTRVLFAPWSLWRREVERTKDIRYGPGGRSNLLDVYRHRSHPTHSPVLIHLHGGRFRWGRKSREARPLLFRLAAEGWTCISANYQLSPSPGEGFPQHLIDVKRVIAWVRRHGHEHGADPDLVILAGSSAGAHLTTMAALTAGDPRLQPGFEEVDTSITAGVGLYGYYGALDDDPVVPSDPLAHLRPDAPPLLVLHGDNDTYTPIEGARHLVDRLRASSSNPVVFAELPGAQHSFDLFHSIRFESVVDAIEAFAAWVCTRQASGVPPRHPS